MTSYSLLVFGIDLPYREGFLASTSTTVNASTGTSTSASASGTVIYKLLSKPIVKLTVRGIARGPASARGRRRATKVPYKPGR